MSGYWPKRRHKLVLVKITRRDGNVDLCVVRCMWRYDFYIKEGHTLKPNVHTSHQSIHPTGSQLHVTVRHRDTNQRSRPNIYILRATLYRYLSIHHLKWHRSQRTLNFVQHKLKTSSAVLVKLHPADTSRTPRPNIRKCYGLVMLTKRCIYCPFTNLAKCSTKKVCHTTRSWVRQIRNESRECCLIPKCFGIANN